MNIYNLILLIVILIFSIVNSYHDIKTMKVYDYPLWFSCYAAIICHLIFNREGLWIYILSAMISGAVYYLIRLISKKKLGIGDVYFGFFQGICLPPFSLAICFGIEILLTLIVMNRKIGKKAFPFVPFMSVGLLGAFIISLFFS